MDLFGKLAKSYVGDRDVTKLTQAERNEIGDKIRKVVSQLSPEDLAHFNSGDESKISDGGREYLQDEADGTARSDSDLANAYYHYKATANPLVKGALNLGSHLLGEAGSAGQTIANSLLNIVGAPEIKGDPYKALGVKENMADDLASGIGSFAGGWELTLPKALGALSDIGKVSKLGKVGSAVLNDAVRGAGAGYLSGSDGNRGDSALAGLLGSAIPSVPINLVKKWHADTLAKGAPTTESERALNSIVSDGESSLRDTPDITKELQDVHNENSKEYGGLFDDANAIAKGYDDDLRAQRQEEFENALEDHKDKLQEALKNGNPSFYLKNKDNPAFSKKAIADYASKSSKFKKNPVANLGLKDELQNSLSSPENVQKYLDSKNDFDKISELQNNPPTLQNSEKVFKEPYLKIVNDAKQKLAKELSVDVDDLSDYQRYPSIAKFFNSYLSEKAIPKNYTDLVLKIKKLRKENGFIMRNKAQFGSESSDAGKLHEAYNEPLQSLLPDDLRDSLETANKSFSESRNLGLSPNEQNKLEQDESLLDSLDTNFKDGEYRQSDDWLKPFLKSDTGIEDLQRKFPDKNVPEMIKKHLYKKSIDNISDQSKPNVSSFLERVSKLSQPVFNKVFTPEEMKTMATALSKDGDKLTLSQSVRERVGSLLHAASLFSYRSNMAYKLYKGIMGDHPKYALSALIDRSPRTKTALSSLFRPANVAYPASAITRMTSQDNQGN